jgi:uncharacterized protein (DUF433 family)
MTYERIEINPDIMDGKPVIRGTRVPVELVLRKLGAGMSSKAIMVDHPRLTHGDILAAPGCRRDSAAYCATVHAQAARGRIHFAIPPYELAYELGRMIGET